MIQTGKKKDGIILQEKKLPSLLHKKTSKHKGYFYCLNCLNSYRTENTLKSHEKVCKNKGFCRIAQVKAGNTSEILLNKIKQFIYSLYQEKEITKKVYNNVMNSIKV